MKQRGEVLYKKKGLQSCRDENRNRGPASELDQNQMRIQFSRRKNQNPEIGMQNQQETRVENLRTMAVKN